MKKKLFKILFGVCLFAVGLNVHAESSTDLPNLENGEGSTNATVTVGSVETPVYNVNIYWDDLSFDWSYDSTANEFGWTPSPRCVYFEGTEGDLAAGRTVYSDESCSVEAGVVGSEESGAGKYYLSSRDSVFFMIEDYSENGQIVPSVEWTSATNYSYVDAEFVIEDEACVVVPNQDVYDVAVGYGIYSDSTCTTETTDDGFEEGKYYAIVSQEKVLTTAELPDTARRSAAGSVATIDGYTFVDHAYARNQYTLNFTLENSTTPTATPTAGDQIGTITVSIRAK